MRELALQNGTTRVVHHAGKQKMSITWITWAFTCLGLSSPAAFVSHPHAPISAGSLCNAL